MSQFSPGEAKIAIAPITAQPAGMACEAELFLGPDELTKVASSGRIPFVSTGAAQNVRLPIAMPPEGTYHGYIDVLTEGWRFLAYKTKEDVVIESVGEVLSVWSGAVEILEINGIPLKNVGTYQALDTRNVRVSPHEPWPVYGIEYYSLPGAELESPIVVSHPIGMTVTIKFRNVNVNIQPGGTKAIGFAPECAGTSMATQRLDLNCGWSPSGYWHCNRYACGDGVNFNEGHSGAGMGSIGIATCKAYLHGHYCKGLYDLVIKVGPVPWDMPWIYGASVNFVIKDAVLVTSEGDL